MKDSDAGSETQVELLERQLLQALESQKSHRLLTFDERFEGRLKKEGHDVIHCDPDGEWPEGPFDVILALGLLERAVDDRKAISRARDRLRRDGEMIISVPMAAPGREPPRGAFRHYAGEELLSVVMRSGLTITEVLTEGPDLIIVQTYLSTDPGAKVVASVAEDVANERWVEAEKTLSSVTDQMEDEVLVREYAMLVGQVHLGRGRMSEALEAFNEASKLAGHSVLPLTAMGVIALTTKDYESAAELLETALELCPTHFPALRAMAMVHEEQGDLDAALTHFDMAAMQRPWDRTTAEKTVSLAADLQRVDAAKQAIERHLKASGDEEWAKVLQDELAGEKSG